MGLQDPISDSSTNYSNTSKSDMLVPYGTSHPKHLDSNDTVHPCIITMGSNGNIKVPSQQELYSSESDFSDSIKDSYDTSKGIESDKITECVQTDDGLKMVLVTDSKDSGMVATSACYDMGREAPSSSKQTVLTSGSIESCVNNECQSYFCGENT